ncbi:hypothetical protein Pcinc_003522 [Petrolisthes cinctipes]|uniref:Uncharacterized protein n=1 Tax=Petrolisthes cinctipes TaxID=88211 RepID=A0AAE1GG64_PETCI|nr:hypothetical protein Pcinc_003522 [Petrolisthes cinctipes]
MMKYVMSQQVLELGRQGIKTLSLTLHRNITWSTATREKIIILPLGNYTHKNSVVEKKTALSVLKNDMCLCNQVTEYHTGRKDPIKKTHHGNNSHSTQLNTPSTECENVKQKLNYNALQHVTQTELITSTECENVKQKLNYNALQDVTQTELNTPSTECENVKQRLGQEDLASETEINTRANHTFFTGLPSKSHDNNTLELHDDTDSSNVRFIQQRSKDESKVESNNVTTTLEHSHNTDSSNGRFIQQRSGDESRVAVSIVPDVVLSSGGGGGGGDGDWRSEMEWVLSQETSDVLTPAKDITQVDALAPELRPTFNLAAYVNKSVSLQQLVMLGVDLSKWDKMKGVANFILTMDFDTHMKPYITFLDDCGVMTDDLGGWLTINPYIMKEQLTNLKARLEYLSHMSFTKQQVARIISRNPRWLLYSTVQIDSRLGFYQRTFKLSGNEVRTLATREPRLITAKLYDIKRTNFSVLEEMGFSHTEMKTLLLTKPKIWLTHGVSLLRRFTYIHNTMGLTHTQLLQFPHVLLSRDFRLRQRHSFLSSIGSCPI